MSKEKRDNLNETHNLAGMALPDYVLRSATATLSKSLIESNRGPTNKEIVILRKRLAQAFQTASIHLAEFPIEQAEVMGYLEVANRRLSSNDHISQGEVIKSEENLIRALIILDRKIKSVKSIQRMIFAVVISSIIYLLLIAMLQYAVYLDSGFSVLGTPGLILAWGCLGGVTVILFRHRSMMEQKWPFDLRWLWIAVRPLLGLIMGAFIYQAISSGLLLFGAQTLQSSPQTQLLWALAFVGGFSDRFWEILIDSVLGPYSQEKNKKN